MKYLVRAIGILAIIVALYIMVGEQLVGSSGSAFVNTRLAAVRTPIAGHLEMAPLAVGARVTEGQSVATVIASASKTSRTLDYERELALTRAERVALANFRGMADQFDREFELERLEAREATLQSLLADQQAAQSSDISANVASPVPGIVWSIAEGNGSRLDAGATITTIARCDVIFIHTNVDERLYNRLAIGDTAQFRASDGQILDATVSLLAGVGPRTLIETLAIEPGADQSQGFTVLLNASGLGDDATCPLGRTGRVIFSRGPLAALSDWLAPLGL